MNKSSLLSPNAKSLLNLTTPAVFSSAKGGSSKEITPFSTFILSPIFTTPVLSVVAKGFSGTEITPLLTVIPLPITTRPNSVLLAIFDDTPLSFSMELFKTIDKLLSNLTSSTDCLVDNSNLGSFDICDSFSELKITESEFPIE